MKTLKFIFLVVLFSGIAALNVDAQGKKKPLPTIVEVVTFDYVSDVFDFEGTATITTMKLNYQLKGTGDVDGTYTYKINGCLAPMGDYTYSGPVTVEIKNGIFCVERATGTATYVVDGGVVSLSDLVFTTPICKKLL